MYVDPKMFNPSKRKRRAFLLNHLLGRHHHTWREHEKDVLRERDADLDRRLLADTDASLMDDEFLEDALRVCLNDTDCIPAVSCLIDIFTNRAGGSHLSQGLSARSGPFPGLHYYVGRAGGYH